MIEKLESADRLLSLMRTAYCRSLSRDNSDVAVDSSKMLLDDLRYEYYDQTAQTHTVDHVVYFRKHNMQFTDCSR